MSYNTKNLIRDVLNQQTQYDALKAKELRQRNWQNAVEAARAEAKRIGQLTPKEVLSLPQKCDNSVLADDVPISTANSYPMRAFGQDPLTTRIYWYEAYMRPGTLERFRVFKSDGP